jgi:hypothetical protein
VTSANGGSISRDQLVLRIATSRKVPGSEVLGALDELAVAGHADVAAGADVAARADVAPGPDATVRLTPAGQEHFGQIRGQVDEITSRLFDFPAEDLATAGRVLSIVTERANAEIAKARG